MPSVVSALTVPTGRPRRLPRWDAPRHLPAPPAPSGRGGFCSIIRWARRRAVAASSLLVPFKGSFAWPVPWNPVLGTLALSSLSRHQAWKEGGHTGGLGGVSAIEGQVYFWDGSWALIHPRSPGWGRGGGDASAEGECPNSWCLGSCAESYACLFVLSLEVRPESQCASSKEPAPQSIPVAPRAGARRAGPCSGGRGGVPSAGSAPLRQSEMPRPL